MSDNDPRVALGFQESEGAGGQALMGNLAAARTADGEAAGAAGTAGKACDICSRGRQ